MYKTLVVYLTLINITLALNLNYLDPTKLQTRTTVQTQTITALKVIRKYSDKVIVKVDTELFSKSRKDTFSLQTVNNKLHIHASTGVAAVWGFNYYLKKYCKSHIGWQAKRVVIPNPLPEVNETVESSDRFRYYQNVCTFSYSFLWWNLTQWTEHVEWMALNGINLSLAPVDQEAIWEKVYEDVGMTNEEIEKHFTGPAFLSWLRMGNVHGWAGPLYKSWHDRQLEIQRGVMRLMYNLGIIPIIPAFSGHVPAAFSRLFPNTKFQNVSSWNSFNRTYCCELFINPSDPLFKTIGHMFLKTTVNDFAIQSSHIYVADLFNEVVLDNMNTEVIYNASKAMFLTLSEFDENAVWLVQNWMFINRYDLWTENNTKAFILAAPKGRMLILDLEAEHRHQYDRFPMYYGQPFIWSMLHNFGGTLGMVGKIPYINRNVCKTRYSRNSTMVGIGLTMEGINTDYVVYDFMLETGWRQNPVFNLISWVEDYAERRYGCKNTAKAWRSLLNGIYDFKSESDTYGRNEYVLTKMPSFKYKPHAWYTSKSLFTAFKYLALAPRKCYSSGFYHDLVDVTRQALLYRAEQIYYYQLSDLYSDANAFNVSIIKYLDLLNDIEQILASNDDFTAKTWLNGARNAAKTEKERNNYEFNARNQITLWGPNGEISDYATKQWAEIFHYYYKPRWTIFLNAALDAKYKNVSFNERTVQSFIRKKVEKQFASVNISLLPKKNPIKLSRKLYKKWKMTDLSDLPLIN